MRRFTLLLLSIFMIASSTFAQNASLNSPNTREFKSKQQIQSIKGAKSLTAEVIAVSKFESGTTMDLMFNITNATPDDEYGDLLELTFPTGVVPTDGTANISPAAGNTPDFNLNPIEGQTISWGDDNNDWGGLAPGSYDFFVTVTIDGSITTSFDIDWHLSGDQYGAAPNETNGTVTVYELPTVPDLTVSVTGFMSEYYSVPLDQILEFSQVTSTVQAIVANEGAILTAATNATVTSTGDYNDEMPITVPMISGAEEFMAFESFKATSIGTETFTFTANASNDFSSENGTVTTSIDIHETDLIRDNGDIAGYFGVGTGGGDYLGNVFTINNKDTLNSVTLFLGTPTLDDVLQVDVFNFDDESGIGSLVGSSIDLIVTGTNKEFTAYFAGEGLILEAGKYLFAVKEDANNMSLARTTDTYVSGSAYVYYQGAWQELGAMGYPHTYYIRPGFGTELPDFDIELASLDMYQYSIKETELAVKGQLINHGTEPLTSIDIAYTVNGGDPVSESITGISVTGIYNFTLSTPVQMPTVGDYVLEVTISNPNGGDDGDLTNNVLTTTISALEYAPAKRIFGEEATGTWCGWCPRGAVFMEYMAETYPETWVGIAVHNGDPMTVTEYDSGIGGYIAGYPSGLIDRAGEYDPSQFEAVYLERIEYVSPVDIKIENVVYNETNGELSFDVAADFLATVEGAKFNAMIVENGVTGTTSGYNQANYYSGGGSGEMGGYELLANPVPAADMVYDHVGRALLGGWNGVDGSISATVNAGETESYTFTTTIDATWNIDEIELVGVIIGSNGEVLNAVMGDIHTGIFASKAKAANFDVYPNPFNNEITINNLENASQIIVSNMLGQAISTINVNETSEVISTSELQNGIYMITVVDNDNNSRTVRVVKQ